MSGTDAEARAALITACVLGFAVLRAALGSPAMNAAESDLIVRKLGSAIQAALAPLAGRIRAVSIHRAEGDGAYL
jgi:hypothetical protein